MSCAVTLCAAFARFGLSACEAILPRVWDQTQMVNAAPISASTTI
jgi:hypothetical protein